MLDEIPLIQCMCTSFHGSFGTVPQCIRQATQEDLLCDPCRIWQAENPTDKGNQGLGDRLALLQDQYGV